LSIASRQLAYFELFQKENIVEQVKRVNPSSDLELAPQLQMAQDAEMNTASQDLPRHLDALREKLQHATDYELALSYFLEEFAGDEPFINQCETEEAPHLAAVLTKVAAAALGKSEPLAEVRVMHLPGFKFYHGNALVAGRVLLFFYFEGENTGLMALIPGVRGGTEVARFRLPGPIGANPKHN
jgi:hypothetical protein